MRTIIVMLNGNPINWITYRSKKEAKMNFNYFKKAGIMNPETCTPLEGAYFELV